MGLSTKLALACGILTGAIGVPAVHASENGGTSYPPGASIYLAGIAPPPGEYMVVVPNYYTADQINDDHGNRLPVPVQVDAESVTLRGFLVTPKQIFGGTYSAQILLPFVHLRSRVGNSISSRSGFADPGISPVLINWRLSDKWSAVVGLDVYIPLGQYQKGAALNIGRNVWSFQPTAGLAYIDPHGLQVQVSPRFGFNTINTATGYHSGSDFTFDYAAGYNLGKLRLGLSGYVYKQWQADKQHGQLVGTDGNKGEAIAVGPTISYVLGPVQATLAAQREVEARNRTKGTNVWMQIGFRF